jgi:hypothetical protein
LVLKKYNYKKRRKLRQSWDTHVQYGVTGEECGLLVQKVAL